MNLKGIPESPNVEDRRGVNSDDQDKLGDLIKQTTISIPKKNPEIFPNRRGKGDLGENMPDADASDGQFLRGIGKADRAKVNAYKVR